MNRIYTGLEVFSIARFDGVFNHGPFYVTVITYTNLIVKNITTHQMPTCIDPIMIYMERAVDVYKNLYHPDCKKIRALGLMANKHL